MKLIPLTQGYSATVDDEDFDALMRHKWCAKVERKNGSIRRIYAIRTIQNGKRQRTVSMHASILPGVCKVDHIDTDGLNNQRHNLRAATNSQNGANRLKFIGKSSRYKGVTWNKANRRWWARICKDGKLVYIGAFREEFDAAQAYNFMADELFGPFARMNVVSAS